MVNRVAEICLVVDTEAGLSVSRNLGTVPLSVAGPSDLEGDLEIKFSDFDEPTGGSLEGKSALRTRFLGT